MITTFSPATSKQSDLVSRLLAERDVPKVWADIFAAKEDYSTKDASAAITYLLTLPRVTSAPKAPALEDGVYMVEGVVFKVQHAVHGSGRQYAKRLHGESGSFEYAPKALSVIRPEHLLTLEQAKSYGAVYGVCAVCGRTLTDEVSITAGIGPVCAGRF